MSAGWILGALLAAAPVTIAAPQGDLRELERKLSDSRERERREAVQELAKLDSGAAWELVFGALDDPEPMVADEAQLQLRALTDPAALEQLLGKVGLGSRDEWVRLRVAEGLGRVGAPLEADALTKVVGDKSVEVRRAAAWSVERLAGRAGLAGDTKKLFEALGKAQRREKDAGTAAAQLLALDALQPFDEARSSELLDDDSAELRAAALLACADLDAPAALALTRRGAVDPSASVRTVALERLAAIGTRDAVLALVELLEQEGERRLAWRAVEELQCLSGSKHRLDPRPWRAWAEGLAPDWRPERGEADGSVEPGTAALAGLPILSERVTFLIDLSGSIWMKRADGRTRKELVDEELRRALEALPESSEFNLIPYLTQPRPWKDRLVPAKASNVQKALDDFEGRKDQGKGNVWDALLLALEDPRVDTLVVVSDGAPSGGRRWNLELMGPLFTERNRFRRVALDAVLTDASNFIANFWGDMTAASGGRVHRVSFE